MRRALALAAAVVLGCAACSATAAQTPPSATTAPATTAPASTSTPTPSSTTPAAAPTTPATPAVPSVPADVPRTGPNTRPGETPPVMPALATQHSAAGARAFAEFFIKTIDWGYATTSSTYMRHYFTKTCEGCESIANTIDRDHRAGNRYIGGRLTVRNVGSSPPSSTTVTVDGTSREVVSKTGKFVSGDPAYPNLHFVVTAAGRPGGWTVTKIGVRP